MLDEDDDDEMGWFHVEKVEQPSEEPPQGKPVGKLYNWVMEEEDVPYYRLFKYGSIIYIYDMHNYFIARQYVYDERTDTEALHAEYRLTLTDKAKKLIAELLKTPFKCYVKTEYTYRKGKLYYKCTTEHSVYVPDPITSQVYQGEWEIMVYIDQQQGVIQIVGLRTDLPFNCGLLQPLWERAVECWVNKIAKIKPRYVNSKLIKRTMLEYKYFAITMLNLYFIS